MCWLRKGRSDSHESGVASMLLAHFKSGPSSGFTRFNLILEYFIFQIVLFINWLYLRCFLLFYLCNRYDSP